MAELESRRTKDIVVSEAKRPPDTRAKSVAAAVELVRARVPLSEVDVDEHAGVASMTVPEDVDLADLKELLGDDFHVVLSQKLQF
jgi:hypothetical protein